MGQYVGAGAGPEAVYVGVDRATRYVGAFRDGWDIDALALPVAVVSLAMVTPASTTAVISLTDAPDSGDFHWYVTTTDTAPSRADLTAGTGAVSFGAMVLGSLTTVGSGPQGLTPDRPYFLFHLFEPDDGSGIQRVAFQTVVADTTAPVILGTMAAPAGVTSVAAQIDTDTASGVWFWVASTSATAPSAIQVQAGQDHMGSAAPVTGAQAVSDVGVQSVYGDVTGLTEGTAYYVHSTHVGANDVPSAVVTAGPVVPSDVTVPIVSSVEIVPTGPFGGTVMFNSDTAEGTAYILVQASNRAAPSITEIQTASQQAVTAAGPQTFTIPVLALGTYRAYVAQGNAAGHFSSVVAAQTSLEITSSYLTYYDDGVAVPSSLVNGTLTDNHPDSDGGTDAVLWTNTGTSSVLLRPAVTYNDGVTVIRGNLKAETWPNGEKAWLRYRSMNATITTIGNIDITNDATTNAARVPSNQGSFFNVTMTATGGGWFAFEARIDMTGAADRKGILQFNMGTAQGGNNVNSGAGLYAVALHDLTFSTE